MLIGKPAPNFSAKGVAKGKIIDNFSLVALRGNYIVLFFYPLDFTFVCPTELHAFQDRLSEFEERKTKVVACSVDSCFSHLAWLNTPRKSGGIQGVEYPILSDVTKQICRSYHVLNEDEGIAYRGLFLIDQNGIIRHIVINDLSLGRSVDEALRMVDALTLYEKCGEVCPANWQSGKKSLKASLEGVIEYFKDGSDSRKDPVR